MTRKRRQSWYVILETTPQSVRSNPLFQSEEDLQLKNELEMLVERLRVRSNTFI